MHQEKMCAKWRPIDSCQNVCDENLHTQGNVYFAEKWYFFLDRPWISPWIRSISNSLDITFHLLASQLSDHYHVISNRLWRLQQNETRKSETRRRCVYDGKPTAPLINRESIPLPIQHTNICVIKYRNTVYCYIGYIHVSMLRGTQVSLRLSVCVWEGACVWGWRWCLRFHKTQETNMYVTSSRTMAKSNSWNI